jgi:hypothetical protein
MRKFLRRFGWGMIVACLTAAMPYGDAGSMNKDVVVTLYKGLYGCPNQPTEQELQRFESMPNDPQGRLDIYKGFQKIGNELGRSTVSFTKFEQLLGIGLNPPKRGKSFVKTNVQPFVEWHVQWAANLVTGVQMPESIDRGVQRWGQQHASFAGSSSERIKTDTRVLRAGGAWKTDNRVMQHKEVHYVYVCMGNYATTYHSNSNCKGLRACKGGIERVSVEKAHGIGRRPCRICY